MDFSLDFVSVISIASLGMLIWACIEVGSNDATNLINAVFGARILKRKTAVSIAGIFVILGAMFSGPVMDTVSKDIFDLSLLTARGAVCVFLASYLVNTVLLYSYSGYGLPVSTTATLVFSLAGAAFGVNPTVDIIKWNTLGRVSAAIFVSISLSGCLAFLTQRMFRGAIRKDSQKHELVLLHGPWISGLLLVSLFWFMIIKGINHSTFVQNFLKLYFKDLGQGGLLICLWAVFTALTHLLLILFGRKGTKYLFHVTSIIGMICMAFAFGQNDLANCASPGLANWLIWTQGLHGGTKMDFPIWTLFCCGFLMYLGMRTKRAQRVTRAEINTASQQNSVKLYAPKWCIALAKMFTSSNKIKDLKTAEQETLEDVAPESIRSEMGKKLHYDPLRASVILAVSACVIAFASGLGLPVSTTYVSFAAVIATGWGDRVFTRGRSDLKMGRAIWVVTCWMMGAVIAAFTSAIIAWIIFTFEYYGLALTFLANYTLRWFFKHETDRHETSHHRQNNKKRKTPMTSPST